MTDSKPTLAKCAVFLSGLLFGLGLIVSGMVNPAKVIGFLDVTDNWDPSLILVMAAALAVTTPAFHFILKTEHPLFSKAFFLPSRTDIDGKLITGAALFGIGWGTAGLCPGPALTAITSLNSSIVIFVVAMIAGMVLYRVVAE